MTATQRTKTGIGSFHAYQVSVEAATAVHYALRGIRKRYYSLRQQAVRSSESVALNTAEGWGRKGMDREHLFRIAYASALECSTALILLQRMRALKTSEADKALILLDRVRAMLYRLCERKKVKNWRDQSF